MNNSITPNSFFMILGNPSLLIQLTSPLWLPGNYSYAFCHYRLVCNYKILYKWKKVYIIVITVIGLASFTQHCIAWINNLFLYIGE